mmetsp:Transcript_1484/g.4427  ORF Transcript_1484/g.4427 Transcript_1484/m.4427 type:complete len:533 (+) Transcript_1484:66-1664(+)
MPPVYKDSTYKAAALWCEDTAIAYGENRKRNPSKSYDRYEGYRRAKTLGEALKMGSKWQDLFFDYEHGMLNIAGPPFRPTPLDLTKVLPANATDFEREMAKSVGRAALTKRTETLAERLGLDKKELGNDREDGETLEMHGQRKEAQTSAIQILEAAEREGRRVTDEEVRLVLSQWAFKNNDSRQNVLPEGQRFVKSDTLGLIPLRDGTVQVTRMTREYPEVCQLFCRWLKDHMPADLAENHVFTSINVNSGYAARMHRDAGNVGPSMIKAFGKFTGGILRYWPDDDQSLKLEEVRNEESVGLNLSDHLALFNGSCAHEVEAFEGERYTLVYFSVSKFPRADPDSRRVCLECGVNMPTEESMQRAKRVLRPPRGYFAKGARPRSSSGSDAHGSVRFWQILDGGVGPARIGTEVSSATSPADRAVAKRPESSGLLQWLGAAAKPAAQVGKVGSGAPPPAEPQDTLLRALAKMEVIEVEDEAPAPPRQPAEVRTPDKESKRPAADVIDASAAKKPRAKLPEGAAGSCDESKAALA